MQKTLIFAVSMTLLGFCLLLVSQGLTQGSTNGFSSTFKPACPRTDEPSHIEGRYKFVYESFVTPSRSSSSVPIYDLYRCVKNLSDIEMSVNWEKASLSHRSLPKKEGLISSRTPILTANPPFVSSPLFFGTSEKRIQTQLFVPPDNIQQRSQTLTSEVTVSVPVSIDGKESLVNVLFRFNSKLTSSPELSTRFTYLYSWTWTTAISSGSSSQKDWAKIFADAALRNIEGVPATLQWNSVNVDRGVFNQKISPNWFRLTENNNEADPSSPQNVLANPFVVAIGQFRASTTSVNILDATGNTLFTAPVTIFHPSRTLP